MRYLLQLLFITIILLATSCASEVGDIDRTQPNKIKKSFFTGEWYMRDTIVDVPFNTAFTFIGEQTETSLVQWDIQQKYLIAYRTYEHNPGTESYVSHKTYGTVCSKDGDVKVLGFNQDCPEGYELESKEAFQGTPVAAYAIQSHFDVQRQYNSSTGEQINVIVEDGSDRPWYEREYMRVDWSKNMIPDFRFGAPNAIPQQGVNFYCSDLPKGVDPYCDRWSPIFDEENGYMSITTKILAQPETFDYYGTTYPTCYLNARGYQDCLGQEITVKTDFMKKTDKQYAQVPVNYDEHKMQKFGYFRTEKYVYDRDRGFLEGAKKYYANIFDIFEKDENGEYTGKINPIVYYVNKDFPEELWVAAKWLADGKPTDVYYTGNQVLRDGWNKVFMDLAREVLGPKFDWQSKEDNIFIICHNPVRKEDNGRCGEIGFSPKIGDLRYNLIYWVNNPQASSPLGYGPLAADPLTGRTISANAFVYGNELEWYTQYVLELVDLVNGTTDIDDYISGRYISEYLRQKADGEIHSNNITINTKPGYKFLDKRISVKDAKKFAEAKLSSRLQGFKAAIKDKKMVGNHFQDRLNSLKGTEIEKALESKEIRALINPSKDFVEGDSDISPLTWLSAKNLKKEEELRGILAKKTIMMSDFNEASMLALAKYIADKITDEGWTREDAFQYIQREIFYGTTIHEVGHNLGLRHNFASHTDSLNFFEEYWDIRIGDGSPNVDDPNYISSLTGILPRYLEKPERIMQQNEKGILEYQYTSIMDYGGRSNTDFQGLGRYDEAAIMFAYGNKIQIFDNDTAQKWKYRDKKDNVAREIYKDQHYTRILYDTNLKGGMIQILGDQNAYVRDKELNKEALFGHRKWVDWNKVLYTKEEANAANDPLLYLTDKANDDTANGADGLVEVPYAFCSDEYHSGTYKCYRFALGVDMYESIVNQEEYFDNWYFITNFKKGKSFFSENSYGYQRRIYGRLDFIANQFKHWVYEALIAREQSWGLGDGSRFYGEDLTVGALESFDFFTKVMGSIDPGFYTLNANNQYELTREKDYLNNWDEEAQAGEIEIPLGIGKYQESHYDTSLGYSYYYTPVIQGVWYDKILAMFILGDEHTNFMGVDASADMLSYAIAYTSIFTEDLMRVIAGIILERPQYYAPFVFDGKYHNPIGLLYSKNALGQGLLGSDITDAHDDLYKQNNANFQYIKSTNPFYVKYYAIVLGFAYFTDVTRFDFEKSMEINVLASGNSFTPTDYDDLEEPIKNYVNDSFGGDEAVARAKWQESTVVVIDPLSKRTYFAVNMFAASDITPEDLPVISIGYELLKDFKILSDNYNLTKADYDADPNNSIKYEAFDKARKALREKRDYIDLITKMMFYFKHPEY